MAFRFQGLTAQWTPGSAGQHHDFDASAQGPHLFGRRKATEGRWTLRVVIHIVDEQDE